MKKIFLSFLILLSGCSRDFVPLFKPERPTVQTLTNGATLFTLEDHSLPTFQLQLFIRGGSVYDPPGKEGLAALAMQSLRTGGTTTKRPQEIDDLLEFNAISLEMGTTSEYLSANLATLKKDLPTGLATLFDLLRHPNFDEERFDIMKRRSLEALRHEREDPLSIAARELPTLIYGPDSPWGRTPSLASLESISRNDVLDVYRRMISPDRFVIAVSGDFSKDLKRQLETLMSDWGKTPPLPPLPVLEKKSRPGLWIIPRPGLTQTTLALGHLGERRENPDKFALLVMNDILGGGGGITSRLGQKVRVEGGKAYGIWSQYEFGKDYGLFRLFAQTASPNTEWVARQMIEITRQMKSDANITRAELKRSRKGLLRSLLFEFETRFQITQAFARFFLWGYPEDYLEDFQKKIAKLSRADIEKVAAQYLDPEGLTILAIGEEEILRKGLAPLSGLGEIHVLELK